MPNSFVCSSINVRLSRANSGSRGSGSAVPGKTLHQFGLFWIFASGYFSCSALGTKPVKPCRIGVIPISRSRCTIFWPNSRCESIQDCGSGPPQPSRLAIHCHAKNAGPHKKARPSVPNNTTFTFEATRSSTLPVTHKGGRTRSCDTNGGKQPAPWRHRDGEHRRPKVRWDVHRVFRESHAVDGLEPSPDEDDQHNRVLTTGKHRPVPTTPSPTTSPTETASATSVSGT